MSKASHLTSAAARLSANECLGSVLAVIGASAAAFTTTGTPAVSHNGILTVLSAQTNTALSALAAGDMSSAQAGFMQPSGLPGFYVQPAATTVYYVICVTSAGTWKVVQGTYDNQDLTNLGGYTAKGKSVIPDVPDEVVPVAVLKVVTAGSAFTPGTTALTTIGTFKNVNVLPVASTW